MAKPKWIYWSPYKGQSIYKLDRPHEGSEPPVGWPDYVVVAKGKPGPEHVDKTVTLAEVYNQAERMHEEAQQPEPTPQGTVGVAKASGEAPGPTMQPVQTAPAGLIPGVPNLYLYAGAGALGLLMLGMMMKKKRKG